ncbi:hypothetical protein TNCV_102031 [Trichonephila clavipes]|nr:hypothetical protein TNCV_102031 [Trichonephila clavipes]
MKTSSVEFISRSPNPLPMKNSPLVSMEIPLRTAYGQAGRCGMQPKPSSLRAQAHQRVWPKLGGMASRSSPTYEFSFPLAAEIAPARAPKYSLVCVSERGRRI